MHTYHICILTSQYIKSILPKYILYRVFLTIAILGTTPLKKFPFEIDVIHTHISIDSKINTRSILPVHQDKKYNKSDQTMTEQK